MPQETTTTAPEEHSDMFHLSGSLVIFLPDSAEALHAANLTRVSPVCAHL